MSLAQFNKAVTPISPVSICHNFFRPNYTQSFLLVTIVFQSSPIQKKISDPLTPSGLDLPTNSVVTFLSPISPPEIPSNPVSPDEPPALSLLPANQPPTINPDVAPSTSVGSQFSISSPEASQTENPQELPLFSSFLSHQPSSLNINLPLTRLFHCAALLQ